MARTPYDVLVADGYGCNVMVAFNVGVGTQPQNQGIYRNPRNVRADAKFDLFITWSDAPDGGWCVTLEMGRAWPRLAERFEAVVGAILDDVEPPTLLPDERATLLEWGTGPTPPIPDVCLHELFEAQVRRTPDALSLIHI